LDFASIRVSDSQQDVDEDEIDDARSMKFDKDNCDLSWDGRWEPIQRDIFWGPFTEEESVVREQFDSDTDVEGDIFFGRRSLKEKRSLARRRLKRKDDTVVLNLNWSLPVVKQLEAIEKLQVCNSLT
jgi:hypothetical protein